MKQHVTISLRTRLRTRFARFRALPLVRLLRRCATQFERTADALERWSWGPAQSAVWSKPTRPDTRARVRVASRPWTDADEEPQAEPTAGTVYCSARFSEIPRRPRR